MLVVLAVCGLGLLAAPGLVRRAGRRLHPAEWAQVCIVAVVGGALVVELVALLWAVSALAETFEIPVLGALCAQIPVPQPSGGVAAGSAAAMAAVALPAFVAVGWRRARDQARRARVEPWLGSHAQRGEHRLIVLPTAGLVAVSVPAVTPAETGQIVVSQGLIDTLGPDELSVVLSHEEAHLRHGHHRYLAVAAGIDRAFGWFPPARRSTGTLRSALERWADQDAAGTSGERDALRRALLAVTAHLVAAPSLAGFSAAETIKERLGALAGTAPTLRSRAHILMHGPAFVVLGLVLVTAGSCTG